MARAAVAVLGTAVVVLAVIGAISLIDDPPWSDDEGSPAVLRDVRPDIFRASEAAKVIAGLRQRPSDRDIYANCVLGRTRVQPFRYICDVRYGPRPRRRQFHIVQRIGTEHFELERDIPWSQRERP